MSDKPILFSASMVRALLAGTKTQTRRVAKLAKRLTLADVRNWRENPDGSQNAIWDFDQIATPRIKVGDRLWVKETSRITSWGEDGEVWITYAADGTRSRALYPDDEDFLERLCARVEKAGAKLNAEHNYTDIPPSALIRPSIFMPRWASRITLTVTDVRVQRLQDISEEDAIAEGVDLERYVPVSDSAGLHSTGEAEATDPIEEYRGLWEAINGAGSWAANPWIMAVSFTVQKGNIDAV